MYQELRSAKVRSKFSLLALGSLLLLLGESAHAAIPGDKRTILTSGDKVYPIRYQMGQSTVLYFGLKPETVICGNKNYFNIEKIKEAITIQPLSSFATNLTVIIGNRRYLFFLMPAGDSRPDGFVEVKWIPKTDTRPVKPLASRATEIVKAMNQKLKLTQDLELTVSKEIVLENGKKSIFELDLKNLSSKPIRTDSIEIVATINAKPIERQATVWEEDELSSKKTIHGRLIASMDDNKGVTLIFGYRGKSMKLLIKGKSR